LLRSGQLRLINLIVADTQALRKSGSAAVLIRVDAQKRQRWECPPYLYANDLLEKGTKRVKLVDGKPLLVDGRPVFVPVQVSDSGLRVRQVADACLYFGNALPEFVQPPLALDNGTDYGREVRRRRAILSH
jgi:hypothetical protein